MAPLDYGYGIRSDFGRNKTVRILVNPGTSVKWKLLDWDYWKTPLPKRAVYIDKKEGCRNVVTAYTGCSDCHANKLTPSQRTNDGYGGYVYYYDKGTNYDKNEYQILIEDPIKKYEILSLELEESLALKEVKSILSTSEVINNSNASVGYKESIGMDETRSSSWSHSIHWEVGIGVEFGPMLHKWSINAKIGGNHQWGESETISKKSTSEAEGRVPGNHGVKIKLSSKQTQKDVPYKAKVKITYDDGSTRTGKKVIIF